MKLFRRIDLRPPRTLKVTREGRYYLGFTLGVGIAATNTGNNLLFLILGMLLALIIVSGLLSEAALRKLEVRRIQSSFYRADDPTLTGIALYNGNKMLPSIGLEVDELPVPNISSSPGHCIRIAPGATGRADIRLTPQKRGENKLEGIKVTTRYPFGIFAKSRRYDLPATILAWPARVKAPPSPRSCGREETGPPIAGRSGVEDLRGLRKFREGDESRRIHWRRSLRVGKMLIVERDAPEGRRLLVELGAGTGEKFEEAVKIAAARSENHLAEGDEVALNAPSGFSVPFGIGPGHRRRILTALARVPQSEEKNLSRT